MTTGSVVVITHNSGGCIAGCLQALGAAPNWEILLIDNASRDNTLEQAAGFSPRVRIIANKENRGFAAALNQAVQLSGGNFMVAMNPDVIPAPGALDHLAEALAEEKTGAAGGLLLDERNQPQRGFLVRRFPTLASTLGEVLLLNRVWPSNPCNVRYRCLTLDYSRQQEVDQPAGAALAFRREAWEQAGGLDEAFYPVWFEDVDFCLRLRQLGWRILYSPEAVFRHGGGHSVNRLSLWERQSYWYANLLRYFRKHRGSGTVVLLRMAIAAGMILRSLAALCGRVPESVSRLEAIRNYAAVMWSYALRGTGKAHPTTPAFVAPSQRRH